MLLTTGFATIVVFIGWLAALVAGRLPVSLHQAFAAVLRYTMRSYSYLYLLTGGYPAGLFGDQPGARVYGQDAGWELVLSPGAKRLIGLLLALGVLTAAGAGALTGASIAAARQRDREITARDAGVAHVNAAVARQNAAVARTRQAISVDENANKVLSDANDTLNGVLTSPSTDSSNWAGRPFPGLPRVPGSAAFLALLPASPGTYPRCSTHSVPKRPAQRYPGARQRAGGLMTWWIVWLVCAAIAVALGFIGFWFSLRTLRWSTGAVAVVLVFVLTRYGLTHPAATPSDLIDSFLRGVDAVIVALLHPLWRTHMVPAPGDADRWIIAAAVLLGYRQLEAWTLHWQAPMLDLSGIDEGQPPLPAGDPAPPAASRDRAARHTGTTGRARAAGHAATSAGDGLTDAQRHAELAAELRFRLPAMEIRSPAILPGGSRTNALASIAEDSGVNGAGIVSAAFQLAGLFWPSQWRVRTRVWIEPASVGPGCRVTVLLDHARTGATVATKTVTGASLQEAASMVAGYIARQIFAMDRSVPAWCYGNADGRDLGAMQLARMERVYAACPRDLEDSRRQQIAILRKATGSVRTAGVVRYELAQLCALADLHLESLWLHGVNRELHERLFRGRYRFAMSLEMIASPQHYLPDGPETEVQLKQILGSLYRCGLTGHEQYQVKLAGVPGAVTVAPDLAKKLLNVAADELHAVGKQLRLWPVVRDALYRRDERPVWLPHWQQGHRETFHDGVAVAELLVAVRRKLIELDHPDPGKPGPGKAGPGKPDPGKPDPGKPGPREKIPPHLRRAAKIASFIAGDSGYLTAVLAMRPSDPWPVPVYDAEARTEPETGPGNETGLETEPETGAAAETGHGRGPRRWPPGREHAGRTRRNAGRDRVRKLPGERRTASWQAAYNTACVYAALAAHPVQAYAPALEERVIQSLRRAVDNTQSELDRPSDWISRDPDFRPLYLDAVKYPSFAAFLREQRQQDYPDEREHVPRRAFAAALPVQRRGQPHRRVPAGRRAASPDGNAGGQGAVSS
ncbi:MAG TPA: DUF4389 domain-containing protein [Trebonia sp.]